MNSLSESDRKLHRVLGTFDLVLLNVAAIVGLRWLSTAAQIGPSSLVLWVLGLITFLIPLALAVMELSSRLPGEGGFYLWTKTAFGELHGFIAGWCYFISNLVFFPALLLFAVSVYLYVGGGSWLTLLDSPVYNALAAIAILWFATLLNISGAERAKWMQNVGGMATWCAVSCVLGGGLIAWHRFGTATPINSTTLRPDLTNFSTIGSFSTIALAYVGLELGPILGGEIKEPRRTIPRALLIACVLIALSYIAGTAALLVALPSSQINSVSGVAQALMAMATRIGLPWMGTVAVLCVAVSVTGSLGAWMTGTARLPFLFGVDRYLPKALGAVHPKFGSPHVALLVQAVLVTLVLLLAVSGSAIREAYAVLNDMTVILTIAPLLYIFLALPVLRQRATAANESLTLIPGGSALMWVVATCGFLVTALAVLLAMWPPAGTASHGLFFLKVVGGSFALLGLGLGFFFRGGAGSARMFAPTDAAVLPRDVPPGM